MRVESEGGERGGGKRGGDWCVQKMKDLRPYTRCLPIPNQGANLLLNLRIKFLEYFQALRDFVLSRIMMNRVLFVLVYRDRAAHSENIRGSEELGKVGEFGENGKTIW